MSSIAAQITSQERLIRIQTFKHLRPGIMVDLQFEAEPTLRIKTKLIGFDEGKYIILNTSANLLRDYNDIIHEGRSCIVRTLVEGEAGQCVAFRSIVDYVPIKPRGLLFITYPDKVESISLRKESRVTTQLPVTFVHRDETAPDALFDAKTAINGYIKDISQGGCRIAAEWIEGQSNIQLVPVFIKVNTAKNSNIIIKAEIKNQTREDPETVSLGMMFVPSPQLDELIKELGL